jgi:hypothetical protein
MNGSGAATGALRHAHDRTVRYLLIPVHFPNPLLTNRVTSPPAIGYLDVTIRTFGVPGQRLR